MNKPPPALDCRQLPESLRAEVERDWTRYTDACLEAGADRLTDRGLLAQIPQVWACSPFIAATCRRIPDLLTRLADAHALAHPLAPAAVRDLVHTAVAAAADENDLMTALRRLRNEQFVRIAWRDLTGAADLETTVAELSELADAILDTTVARLYRELCKKLGTPYDEHDIAQRPVIIALGKLGARELNFSSDIDLMFAFSAAGATKGGQKKKTSEQFFIALGQKLIRVLNDTRSDGFVFRVDMRLRPFGSSGALAMSFSAMENYYVTHGRDWERYALIRARIAGGDHVAGKQLLEALHPFVYRRYLDFGVFESLRNMKALIDTEIRRADNANNIKLGVGGIREIEFIVQALQLIRGGTEPKLRTAHIANALAVLGTIGQLPAYAVRDLTLAYEFLRNTEHRLQQIDDQQTHDIPDDSIARERVALGMGFSSWPAFAEQLDHHRRRVREHFEMLFAAPQTGTAGTTEAAPTVSPLSALWAGALSDSDAAQALTLIGFSDPKNVLDRVHSFQNSFSVRHLTATGGARLASLMPLLLGAVAQHKGSSTSQNEILDRVLEIIEAIARRSVYLSLLIEQPLALSQLIRLCAASTMIAQRIKRFPAVLDELLDPRSLYEPADRKTQSDELDMRLRSIDDDDEQAMDVLRQFKHAHLLRIAAADISAAIPTTAVSSALTTTAEIIVSRAIVMAHAALARRYGVPMDGAHEAGVVVIAYGKLGGLELGYGSDLDLVFIHGGNDGETNGPKSVHNHFWFARLVQRFVHILGTRTSGGRLYEVDLRLRPRGASGLPTMNAEAFENYLRNEAWTWELQALVRARPIAGPAELADAFARIRRRVLGQTRDPDALALAVRDMREKMRRQLDTSDKDWFDLKHGLGGITDIEFMVQYGVLRWSHGHPALLDFTDNIRLLEVLATGQLIGAASCRLLHDAYIAYRARLHQLALQEAPGRVRNDALAAMRDGVIAAWNNLLVARD